MDGANNQAAHAAPVLIVESAIHGPIRLPLLPGVAALGRGVDADLVLGDPSLAALHLRLHVADTVAVEAVDAAVLLADGSAVQPGGRHALAATTAFTAGEVGMRIELPDSPLPPPSAPSRPAWGRFAAGAVALGIAGSAAFAFAGGGTLRVQPPAPSHPPIAAPVIPVPDEAMLQDQLRQRQLSAIRLDTLPDGSLRASGSILPAEVPAWRDAKQWFDATAAGRAVLTDNVSVAAPAPPLAIQSAFLGERPYVIDGAGQKLFPGAALAQGWIIEAIEPGRVLLRREDRRMAVRF